MPELLNLNSVLITSVGLTVGVDVMLNLREIDDEYRFVLQYVDHVDGDDNNIIYQYLTRIGFYKIDSPKYDDELFMSAFNGDISMDLLMYVASDFQVIGCNTDKHNSTLFVEELVEGITWIDGTNMKFYDMLKTGKKGPFYSTYTKTYIESGKSLMVFRDLTDLSNVRNAVDTIMKRFLSEKDELRLVLFKKRG